jgi:hypothetical protein
VKSSNADKHWPSPSGPRVRPPFPTVPPQLWLPGRTPTGPPGGHAIEFLLKVIARCCTVTSQLSPVSN